MSDSDLRGRRATGGRRTECTVYESGTLVQHFYGELQGSDRELIEAHLLRCASCQVALAEIGAMQEALASRPAVAAPASGDWCAFMARLDAAIADERASSAPTRVSRTQVVSYLAMAALLVLVTLSVLAAARWGRDTTRSPAQQAQGAHPPETTNDNASLEALAEDHFERSKLVVLGLASKDPSAIDRGDWAYERQLASRLLSDTRLYRVAAEERGMSSVAGVMRDLELVLLEVSMSEDSDPQTLSQLQRLIQKRDLVQKISLASSTGL